MDDGQLVSCEWQANRKLNFRIVECHAMGVCPNQPNTVTDSEMPAFASQMMMQAAQR